MKARQDAIKLILKRERRDLQLGSDTYTSSPCIQYVDEAGIGRLIVKSSNVVNAFNTRGRMKERLK